MYLGLILPDTRSCESLEMDCEDRRCLVDFGNLLRPRLAITSIVSTILGRRLLFTLILIVLGECFLFGKIGERTQDISFPYKQIETEIHECLRSMRYMSTLVSIASYALTTFSTEDLLDYRSVFWIAVSFFLRLVHFIKEMNEEFM